MAPHTVRQLLGAEITGRRRYKTPSVFSVTAEEPRHGGK